MYNLPSNRAIATTKSSGDFTSCDLYIKSLEESLALACNYMTNAPTTAPAPTPVVDPMAILRLDMEAQRKQFKLLLKQNLDLLPTFATQTKVHQSQKFMGTPHRVPQLQEDVHLQAG